MADIKIPEIKPSDTPEEKVNALYDAYFMMRKWLTYAFSGVLDEGNVLRAQEANIANLLAGSITADQIDIAKGKIQSAQIEELTVGGNVGLGTAQDETGVTTIINGVITTDYIKALGLAVGDEILMGPNATMSYTKLTDKPNIPQEYTNAMALAAWEASNYATYIDANGVYSGSFNGGMFNVNPTGSATLPSGITIGGWWDDYWKGQAMQIKFEEFGRSGFPGTVFSSEGGVPIVFQTAVSFEGMAVYFDGATVYGLNVIAKLG
jgi:hypothetical protein